MARYLDNFGSRLRFAAGLLVYVLAALAFEHGARGSIIVFDTFTAPNDTALIGRAPAPTDSPGATYEGNGNVSTVGGFTGGTPYEADIQTNAARVGADAGLGLNLNITRRSSSNSRFHLTSAPRRRPKPTTRTVARAWDFSVRSRLARAALRTALITLPV